MLTVNDTHGSVVTKLSDAIRYFFIDKKILNKIIEKDKKIVLDIWPPLWYNGRDAFLSVCVSSAQYPWLMDRDAL